MPTTHFMKRWIKAGIGFGLGALLLSGCNLAFDLEDYPYQGPLVVELDLGDDATSTDVGPDAAPGPDVDSEPDIPDLPVGEPNLVITEVLIDTSQMEPGIIGELGEYVEVKNVGDGPADPRNISFTLENVATSARTSISVPLPSSTEQVKTYSGLKMIAPGEYFVFVRYTTPDVPLDDLLESGRYFDWGRYGQEASLTNSGERLLLLRYFDGQDLTEFDRLRWRSGVLVDSIGSDEVTQPIVEDTSLSLLSEFERPELNDDPDVWCLETQAVADGSPVQGSPGQTAQCE